MADKANLKIAAQPAISDDDPFAELTRLMGFDPRQPVKPAVAKPARPVAVEPANDVFSETDLSLDLERELMGDFAADEVTAPAVAQAPEVYADEAPTAQEALAPVAEQPEYDEVAEMHARIAEAEAAHHAAMARAGTVETAAEQTPAAEQHWFRPVDAAAPAEAEAAESGPSLAEAEISAPIEPDMRASAEVQLPEAVQAWSAEASEDVAPEVQHPEVAIDDEAGMAVAAEPEFATEAPSPEWALQPHFDMADEARHELAGDAESVASFDREEEAPSFELPEAISEPVHSAAHHFEPLRDEPPHGAAEAPRQAAPEQALEVSLEQELNALLGNDLQSTPAAAQVLQSAPAEAPEQEIYAPPEAAFDEEREAAPSFERHAPVSVETLPVYDEADERADHQPFDTRPIDLANQHGHEWHSSSVKPVAAAAGDDLDSLFDDQAFEAAITNAVARTDMGSLHGEPAALRNEESEESMPRDGHDPYAALAALSADLKSGRSWQEAAARPADANPYAPQAAFTGYRPPASAPGAADMPDIETVDVPEQAVALADDLDLPELAYQDEPTLAPRYDDIDAEFSHLLQDMNVRGVAPDQAAPAQPAGYSAASYHGDYFDDRVAGAAVAGGAAIAAAALARPPVAGGYDLAYSDAPRATSGQGAQAGHQPEMADMEFAYDPDLDEEIAGPAYTPVAQPPRRRGLMIAAVVGGVALLGGVAAFALSFGDRVGSQDVALVKADPSPVKVKPENPGGATIPNQDSKVYDSVAGANAPAVPAQEKLLSSAEEPVDMSATEEEPVESPMSAMEDGSDGAPAAVDNTPTAGPVVAGAAPKADAPAPKGEDRIEQVAQDDPGVDNSVEVAAVAPRKVRTMIVKADGTLVAREDPAPAADQPVTSASEGIVAPVASTAMPADAASAEPAAAADTAAPATAAQPAASEPAAPRAAGATPNQAPIAPTRPSDQPVDIVGEVKPQQVAALSPAASAGAWSMQIASQPTEAAAQSTYQDLSRRYASVLGGKQASIVKAEIAGKGTFWRVRVPAGSRNDAIKLCESYKSAGGNCFVSK